MLSVLAKPLVPINNFEVEICKFIRHHHDEIDQEKYKPSISKIVSLRDSLQAIDTFGTYKYLEIISKYILVLDELEEKFDFSSENGLNLKFKWHDSINEDVCTQSSIAFERANIYFNLASCLSSIAAKVDVKNEDKLKEAVQFFMLAGNIFNFLIESFLNPPFFDLSPQYLSIARAVMLAQAHECSILLAKASNSSIKSLIRLYQQAANLWGNALAVVLKSPRYQELLGTEMKKYSEAKECFYQIQVHFNRSVICKEEKNWGEQVARLRLTEALFCKLKEKKTLNSSSMHREEIEFLDKNLSKQLEESEKLNSLVYLHPVPKTLSSISGTSIITEKNFLDFVREKASFSEFFPGLVAFRQLKKFQEQAKQKQQLADEFQERFKLVKGEAKRSFAGFDEKSYECALTKQFTIPNRMKNDVNAFRKSHSDLSINSLISELESKKASIFMKYNQAISLIESDNHEFNNFVAKFSSSFSQIPTAVKGAHLISSLNLLKQSCEQAESTLSSSIQEPFKKHQMLIGHLYLPEEALSTTFTATCISMAVACNENNPQDGALKDAISMRALISEAQKIENDYEKAISELKKSSLSSKITTSIDEREGQELDLENWQAKTHQLGLTFRSLLTEFNQNMEKVKAGLISSAIREAAYLSYSEAILACERIYFEGEALSKSFDEISLLATRLLQEVKEFCGARSQERNYFISMNSQLY